MTDVQIEMLALHILFNSDSMSYELIEKLIEIK